MSRVLSCVSPVDQSVLYERPVLGNGALAQSLAAARKAQEVWQLVPLTKREEACGRFVQAMLSMRKDIVPELAWQMGRPVQFGDGEMHGFEERARHMISIARDSLAPLSRSGDGVSRYVSREAVGAVLVIAPWNYPYLTAVNSVIPALMAGNAVLLKHASQTLLVGDRFQTAADHAELPEGLFQHLVLSHEQVARLVEGGAVDRVNFTGSVAGGRAVAETAGRSLIGVGLELGGKDPAYVRADASLPFAIENLVDGAYFNSGQSCCGIERIYVHESVFDKFVGGFADLTSQYVLGSPLVESTTLGPLVSAGAADFVREQIQAALEAGATPLVDAALFDRDEGCYLPPQALINVDHSMSVMTDESFGPVVGIMAVASDDEAVARMNDSRYGLSASIWTKDLVRAEQLGRRVQTGTVYANRCDYLDPALAWTGVKDTGHGATLSTVGYESLTRPKSFYLREEQ